MTLEAEAAKARGGFGRRPPGTARSPTGFDRLFQAVAFLLLLLFVSAALFVLYFYVEVGFVIAMAGLWIFAAHLASRLHELRKRLDEPRSAEPSAAAPPPSAPAPGPGGDQ